MDRPKEWKCPDCGNGYGFYDGVRYLTRDPRCPCPNMPFLLRLTRILHAFRHLEFESERLLPAYLVYEYHHEFQQLVTDGIKLLRAQVATVAPITVEVLESKVDALARRVAELEGRP
jgi:hypothetical protein